jgi:hypothetical protein
MSAHIALRWRGLRRSERDVRDMRILSSLPAGEIQKFYFKLVAEFNE